MFFIENSLLSPFPGHISALAGCQGDVASWRPTHTYYINLASAVKNKEFMVRQLDTLGLDYSRFPAHDVPRLGAPRLHEALPPHALPLVDADAWQSLSHLSTARIGCYASHLSLWLELASKPEGHYLILEDDVRVDKGFDRRLQLIFDGVDTLPLDWTVLYLIVVSHFSSAESVTLEKLWHGLQRSTTKSGKAAPGPSWS